MLTNRNVEDIFRITKTHKPFGISKGWLQSLTFEQKTRVLVYILENDYIPDPECWRDKNAEIFRFFPSDECGGY